MFKYDSVHGPWQGTVKHETDGLNIDGKHIRSFSVRFVLWGATVVLCAGAEPLTHATHPRCVALTRS